MCQGCSLPQQAGLLVHVQGRGEERKQLEGRSPVTYYNIMQARDSIPNIGIVCRG